MVYRQRGRVLTEQGLQKLNNVIKEKVCSQQQSFAREIYHDSEVPQQNQIPSYNFEELHRNLSNSIKELKLNSETLAKIVTQSVGCDKNRIESLFKALGIELEENDFEYAPRVVNNDDICTAFDKVPVSLRSHILSDRFKTLVESKVENFVGREYIFQQIDTLIDELEFRSGYIIINGEPGIGKTSLAAKLVKEKDCIHHFNIAAENIISHNKFLTNICAQLIVKYKLSSYSELPKEAEKDSSFLSKLLKEATKTKKKINL